MALIKAGHCWSWLVTLVKTSDTGQELVTMVKIDDAIQTQHFTIDIGHAMSRLLTLVKLGSNR